LPPHNYWAIFNGIEAPPGEAAVAVANARAAEFEAKYRARYPGAVDSLLSDLSSLTAHLHFPVRLDQPDRSWRRESGRNGHP